MISKSGVRDTFYQRVSLKQFLMRFVSMRLRESVSDTVSDTERYLLTCSRYIELNPVRAWMKAIQLNTHGQVIASMLWVIPIR